MPIVSIIIPIYNAERYLQECLESIRVQSYKDFEVILVDDGSTDKSASICNAFVEIDKRFHYYHKTNGGVSSARNAGLEKASGDWIAFIDADDWVSPHYLQTVLGYSPMADITFFGETTMSDNEETVKTVLSDRAENTEMYSVGHGTKCLVPILSESIISVFQKKSVSGKTRYSLWNTVVMSSPYVP